MIKKIFLSLATVMLLAIFVLFTFPPSKTIATRIDIDASPEHVWEVVSDVASYEDWNPFVIKFDGPFEVGAKASVFVQPLGAESPSEFSPTIVTIEEHRAFAWNGSLPVPRLFTGLHKLELEPIEGGTRFHHSEEFSGVLLHLINPDDFVSGFEAMDQALKERVEARG